MNWNNIKEKYPKSYERLNRYYLLSARSDINGINYPHPRELYDFFDEQGIYIDVSFDDGKLPMMFWVDIYSTVSRHPHDDGYELRCEYTFGDGDRTKNEFYKTRTEAEEKAFEKAFEILEDKCQ